MIFYVLKKKAALLRLYEKKEKKEEVCLENVKLFLYLSNMPQDKFLVILPYLQFIDYNFSSQAMSLSTIKNCTTSIKNVASKIVKTSKRNILTKKDISNYLKMFVNFVNNPVDILKPLTQQYSLLRFQVDFSDVWQAGEINKEHCNINIKKAKHQAKDSDTTSTLPIQKAKEAKHFFKSLNACYRLLKTIREDDKISRKRGFELYKRFWLDLFSSFDKKAQFDFYMENSALPIDVKRLCGFFEHCVLGYLPEAEYSLKALADELMLRTYNIPNVCALGSSDPKKKALENFEILLTNYFHDEGRCEVDYALETQIKGCFVLCLYGVITVSVFIGSLFAPDGAVNPTHLTNLLISVSFLALSGIGTYGQLVDWHNSIFSDACIAAFDFCLNNHNTYNPAAFTFLGATNVVYYLYRLYQFFSYTSEWFDTTIALPFKYTELAVEHEYISPIVNLITELPLLSLAGLYAFVDTQNDTHGRTLTNDIFSGIYNFFVFCEYVTIYKNLKRNFILFRALNLDKTGKKQAIIEKLENAKHTFFNKPASEIAPFYNSDSDSDNDGDNDEVPVDVLSIAYELPTIYVEQNNLYRLRTKKSFAAVCALTTIYPAYLLSNDKAQTLYNQYGGSNDTQKEMVAYTFGIVSCFVATSVVFFQTWKIIDSLFDLFSSAPQNIEPGRKNKVFNAVNLVISSAQSALRTFPEGLSAYFVLSDKVPSSLVFILLAPYCFAQFLSYINFYFEQYEKIQGSRIAMLFSQLLCCCFPLESFVKAQPQYYLLIERINLTIDFIAGARKTHIDAFSKHYHVEADSHSSSGNRAVATLRQLAENL